MLWSTRFDPHEEATVVSGPAHRVAETRASDPPTADGAHAEDPDRRELRWVARVFLAAGVLFALVVVVGLLMFGV